MQSEPKKSVADMHLTNEGVPRTQRPSLLMDLLTGDLGSRAPINRTPVETPISHSTGPQTGQSPYQSTNSSTTAKTTLASQAVYNAAKRGEAINLNLSNSIVGTLERFQVFG